MSISLYWHDYETFGVDPRRDRPAQFAGLRTDENLNEIGEPLVIYCKPAGDVLPQPGACMLTGITPQLAYEKGETESQFITRIHKELSRPGTCGVGYNTLRFDDEVTRNTLYRNFFEPYSREWQNRNSRWDIIDLVRMTYALRPDGIQWPQHEDGRPSFKLEDLAAANGIGHESAHDALSDVRATISLARLVREKQPKLYDWLFQLRSKHKAAEQLDLVGRKSVLYTSRMYPSENGCTTLVIPLLREAGNKNSILVYDLRVDPTPFLELDQQTLSERLFTKSADLPEGQQRLPVKSLKINKCPALAPQATLDQASARRISIDIEACNRHRQIVNNNDAFIQRIARAYGSREFSPANDVDLALYDGFLGDTDRDMLDKVRSLSAQELAQKQLEFKDKRLPELLFRYRARKWPENLSEQESQRWQNFCQHRLYDADGGGSITMDEYGRQIAQLRVQHEGDAAAWKILDALEAWVGGAVSAV
ncbi:MAG TPA: exodeoxyribonuclease I [Gammaproteobacteria bacterium]|nr:exodeoxyribonuclease I [Gammaproteobacteria bacterium]